jgi:hypothetical protein
MVYRVVYVASSRTMVYIRTCGLEVVDVVCYLQMLKKIRPEGRIFDSHMGRTFSKISFLFFVYFLKSRNLNWLNYYSFPKRTIISLHIL